MIDKIELDRNNRMLRRGFGKHEGRWFGRIDLWWSGYRFTGSDLVTFFVLHTAIQFLYALFYGGFPLLILYWIVK